MKNSDLKQQEDSEEALRLEKIYRPVEKRIEAQQNIARELVEYLQNYPHEQAAIPGKRREAEFLAN